MSLSPVIIRTAKKFESMNEMLIEAINNLIKSKKEIPLIYEYLHNPNKELIIDSDNKIGTISNVRKDKKGNIIGDVAIYNILKLANNYQGCIDNLTASYHPDTKQIEIDAFIIYDKTAKENIKSKRNQISDLSKPGEAALMSEYGPEMMKDISDALIEEYNKLVSTKQIDKIIERGEENGPEQ